MAFGQFISLTHEVGRSHGGRKDTWMRKPVSRYREGGFFCAVGNKVGNGKTGHKKRAYEINVSPCICCGSGGWIRTNDLRVMSPTSYQTAPPRGNPIKVVSFRTDVN